MIEWAATAGERVRLPYTPLPAISFVPMVFTLMHLRLWTLFLTFAVAIVLGILQVRRRSATWVWRRMKSKMRGGVVQSRPIWYRRRFARLESFDGFSIGAIDA